MPSFRPGVWDGEAAAGERSAMAWIWDGFLAAGKITLLTSLWKSGKTTLVSLLLSRRARGGTLAGRKVKAGKTAVISEEDDQLWAERRRRLDFGGKVFVLHLPGEAFIEYQLAAQKMRPVETVFVASYGDDGCGYIPTAKAFLEGGYEPTVALAGPESEAILLKAMAKLLKAKAPE